MKIAYFLLMLTLLILNACTRHTTSDEVIAVSKQLLVVPQRYSGIIKPLSLLNITASADGTIESLPIHLGQNVTVHSVLVVLNSPKYAHDYQQALLTYLKTKSDYSNQVKKFQGTTELWVNGLIARNDYDSQQSDLTNAYAQLLQQQHELNTYLSTASNLDQSLQLKDQQQLKAIFQQQSRLLTILAPSNGIVLAPLKSNTNSANADNLPMLGTNIKAGDSLLSLGNLSGYLIDITVNQMDIDTIKVGQKAQVTSDAFPETLIGTVSQVGIQAQHDDNAGFSGMPSFPVQIRVDVLPITASEHIRLGMSTQVAIETGVNLPTLSIPIKAVGQVNGQTVVMRVVHKKYQRVVISTGITTPDHIQVLTGLTEGENILATYPT